MPTVLYEQKDRVVTITLNRPDAMNAVDPETHEALIDAWLRFRDDDSAWVAILTGAGDKAFSAGADLKTFVPAEAGGGGGIRRKEYGFAGITKGMEIYKPIIAAINGFCLAGGLEQALCCDLRVASTTARFALTEVRWAIIPGGGGTQRLPRAIPLAKAMELTLLAEPIDAQEALRIGLVNKVVEPSQVMPTALAWAQTLCERGPLALRAAKEAILRGLSLPLTEGLRIEDMLSASLRGTLDAVEGPKAFAEKRKPRFLGR